MIRAAGVWRVLRKELVESTRDRNLLLNVVVMPLFLYPVIGFGVFQILQVLQGVSEQRDVVIALDGPVPAAVEDSLAVRERHVLVPLSPELEGEALTVESFREWRAETAETHAPVPDVALRWTQREAADSATVVLDGSRDRSLDAARTVRDVLGEWERSEAVSRLQAHGLDEADLDVWRIEDRNTASATERGEELLSAVLPLVLLLMLTMGTFASVLDTVVGERERGTLETMLVSPLRKGEVLVGKYLYVMIASLVAFVLNLGSMALFLGFVLRLLDIQEDVQVSIEPQAFAFVMLAAVLLAALLAAVLMTLAITAKTYREGQATLNPVYLGIMVPGLVVASSRDPFSLSQAAVPVLNAVALFKSALRGEFPPAPFLVTYLVLAVCAALALAFAARLASREDVLLEPRVKLRELLTGRGGKAS